MAGSLNHLVGPDGRFWMETIENMGDAEEALYECFNIIRVLTGGRMGAVNKACDRLGFPRIKQPLRPGLSEATVIE